MRLAAKWVGFLVLGFLPGLAFLSHPPAPSPAPPPGPIRIATWNLEWLNRREGEGKVRRAAADYARLAGYARRLDADVVALQEIDGEEAARRVFDPAAYAFHVTGDEGNLQRTGFAFRKGLQVTPFPDVLDLALEGTRRGADIGVEIGGRELRLLSVHLKTGCWGDPLDTPTESCGILRRQLPALEAWIDARAREGVPFAVLGDLNRRFPPGDPFWTALDDGDPPGARLLDAGAGRPSHCGREASPFVDHIILGSQAGAWVVPGSFREILFDPADAIHRAKLSDHCPIAVTFSAGARPAAPPAAGTPAKLRPGEAARHAGEVATVCGAVASARFASGSRRQPTFLNLERPYPDQPFTVVIFGADRPAFGAPEVSLLGKRICVTGTIEIYRGKPEIVASTPAQIVLETGP